MLRNYKQKRGLATTTTTTTTIKSKPITRSQSRSNSHSTKTVPRKHHPSSSFVSTQSQLFPSSQSQPQQPIKPANDGIPRAHGGHRVLIVGGGASGLALATRLGHRYKGQKRQTEVMLVDKVLTHTWKPSYHELAVGSMNSFEDEVSYWGHGARHNFGFICGELAGVDPDKQRVHLKPIYIHSGQQKTEIAPARYVDYDTLVLSIGSQCNDFNTPGAAENCIFLDSRAAADTFHARLLDIYVSAQAQNIKLHHGARLNEPISLKSRVVAVGGGLTGVELLSELAHVMKTIKKYNLQTPANFGMTLIESGPRILPALDPDLSREVHEKLNDLGIEILSSTKVLRVEPGQMICQRGDEELVVPFTLSAWCAGIKVDEATQFTGLDVNHINQIKVKSSLQSTKYPNIFALGDAATFTPAGETRPLPASAQVAHQQASFLAKALPRFIQDNSSDLGEFKYQHSGTLVSIGKKAVGVVFDREVHSFVAGIMYYSMYRFHQIELHGVRAWLWIWKDIISYFSKPHIKLH